MRVIADESSCDGHGECVDACPDVFALDENDMVQILLVEPDAPLHEAVERAVGSCPKEALTIEH